MWFKLTGDARLGRCASEGCGGQPTDRLEADGVGSNYCSGCREKIEGVTKQDRILLARVAAIICEETCGLTSECKSREAARVLFDKGYLRYPAAAASVLTER